MNFADARHNVRRFIRRVAGRDIIRYTPLFSTEARLAHILNWLRIDVIVDVGAGHGEFGNEVLANGFEGSVISVEPLQNAHDDLVRAARKYPRWTVVERCAAGRQDGEAVLHVTRRSGSSSLRRPGQRHAQTDKDSIEVRQDRVVVRRLDRLVIPRMANNSNVFLKVDVQGAEEDVVEGAQELMPRVKGMQIELSVVELYEGQKLMPEMLSLAARNGFALWGLAPVYLDETTGQTLQYDGIFCRE